MEYYNNILCMPAHDYYHVYSNGAGKGDIVKRNFVPYNTYKTHCRRYLEIVRQGLGEGNYALIAFDSIPPKYQDKIRKVYVDVEKAAKSKPLAEVHRDYKAVEFFTNYRYADGTSIRTDMVDNITLWSNNASILNAIATAFQSHIKARAILGKKPLKTKFFESAAEFVKSPDLKLKFMHNLPESGRKLKDKFELYVDSKAGGYESLIKDNVGKNNSQKIDEQLLELFAIIAVHPTRPYNTKVVEYYMQFMRGERDLIDKESGEIFNPADFLDKDGKIIEVTESAIWYRLNKLDIQLIVDKRRMGAKDFNDLHRPHHHRHAPEFAFSKISMDDRDLIWKDRDTRKRVKAYYAYDVASGCRIGSAYSMDKNEELFLDCLRDMFVFADRHGFGVPLEVEVENHLVRQFEHELTQMFPIVNFCAPGNSQQKRAEHFNRYVKYQVEKNNHPGVGRWWLSSKYNRISVDKIDDQFKQKMKTAERMIVDDIQDTLEYNNSLHPNQTKYPGMTRMDVLKANMNPDLPKLNKSHIYRYIGYQVETSITRNQYVKCQYTEYMLPHPRVLSLLKPNDREVMAYYIPEEDGSINEIHLYQDGNFICTAGKLHRYNEAKAERTEADKAAMLAQDKYIAQFDAMVKAGAAKLGKLEIAKPIKEESIEDIKTKVVEERQPMPTKEWATIDYSQKAFDDFL